MQDRRVPEKSMSIISNRDDSSLIQFGYYTNRYSV
jgi:hypothetical protein